MFILAQILSFIAMVTNMLAVQLETKKQILLTNGKIHNEVVSAIK